MIIITISNYLLLQKCQIHTTRLKYVLKYLNNLDNNVKLYGHLRRSRRLDAKLCYKDRRTSQRSIDEKKYNRLFRL